MTYASLFLFFWNLLWRNLVVKRQKTRFFIKGVFFSQSSQIWPNLSGLRKKITSLKIVNVGKEMNIFCYFSVFRKFLKKSLILIHTGYKSKIDCIFLPKFLENTTKFHSEWLQIWWHFDTMLLCLKRNLKINDCFKNWWKTEIWPKKFIWSPALTILVKKRIFWRFRTRFRQKRVQKE